MYVLLLLDFDECSNDTQTCGVDATCINTPGNYSCVCNTGFDGDGYHCNGKLKTILRKLRPQYNYTKHIFIHLNKIDIEH